MNHLLRDTVVELAGEARSAPDLVTGALVRGRQLRRRRQVGMGAAAVLLAALTAVPYVVLRDTRQTPTPPVTTHNPSPTPSARSVQAEAWSSQRPYEMPGGWVVAGLSNEVTAAVLDPATRRYRSINHGFTSFSVSPDGRYAAVSNDAHGDRIGILTVSTNKTRWTTAGFTLEPQWSSDSKRLLTTGNQRYYVVTAATGEVRRQNIDSSYSCTDYCLLTWLPGDTEIAWAKPGVNGSEASAPTVSALSVFDVSTGKWTRDVPLPGAPMAHDAWSPDGRLAVIRSDGWQSARMRIAEVATGRILAQLPAGEAYFVDKDHILLVSDGRAMLMDTAGRTLEELDIAPQIDEYRLSVGPAY